MKQQKQDSLRFYFIVVVWGAEYIDMLLHVALRSFLSPQNIPGLVNLAESKFIFVTTTEDFKTISQSPIYEQLAHYIKPVFVELDAPEEDNIYCRMTRGYELGTALAVENQAHAVYLLPDCILSDGTITRLEYYATQGRDVVLLPGPRVIKEKVMHYVDSLALKPEQPLVMPPRQMVAFGLDAFHDEFCHYNITEKSFTKWPHMTTWNIPGEKGILVRAFHLHPIMVNCAAINTISFNKFDTIDGSFIQKNFFDLNRFLWETDSDNMILYSMTHEKDRTEAGLVWDDAHKKQAIIEISQSHLVNALQKVHFYNAYKLHVNDLNPAWDMVQRQSFAIVNETLNATAKEILHHLVWRRFAKRCLSYLPSTVQAPMKRVYWRTQGAISWCKAKI